LLLLVAWGGSEYVHRARSTPPSGVVELEEFLARMPVPTLAREFEQERRTYYELLGPRGWGLAVPSGPPAYVFDHRGRLVAWTADRGDAPAEYRQHWSHAAEGRPLSVADVVAQVCHLRSLAPTASAPATSVP
jgi:hypothetical protein